MALLEDNNSERREHFRLNDTIFLEYKPLDHDTAEKLGRSIANPLLDTNQQQVQLRSLQTAFTILTDQINHYDRDVARALRLLNDKIDIISRSFHKQNDDELDAKATEVNLSGGGIAFLAAEEMAAKTPLTLQMELRPSNIVIDAIANVISCTKAYPENAETPFLFRLAFTYMNELDRNLLIKHILSRQAEELRANNNNLNSGY